MRDDPLFVMLTRLVLTSKVNLFENACIAPPFLKVLAYLQFSKYTEFVLAEQLGP